MNKIAESAFIDELEKIAVFGIGRGIKRGATAFVRELKGGVAEAKARGLEEKLKRFKGEVAETEAKIPAQEKKPFNWKPWAIGGAGLGVGSGLAYALNDKGGIMRSIINNESLSEFEKKAFIGTALLGAGLAVKGIAGAIGAKTLAAGAVGGLATKTGPGIVRGIGRGIKGAWQGIRNSVPAAAAAAAPAAAAPAGAAPAAAAAPGKLKRFAKGALGTAGLLGLSAVGGAAAATAGSPYEVNP